MLFKFKDGDFVKSTDYPDNDEFKRQSIGKVLWLEDDGKFALEVNRSKHGMGPWMYKDPPWDLYKLA